MSALSPFRQDLRFAARNLGKQPGLAVAAVLTLALGIGANTAIFSLVDALLLTPPPFRDPASLRVAWASNPEVARSIGVPDKLRISGGDFYDLRRESRTLDRLSLLTMTRLNLSGGAGEPEQIGVARVSGDFFGLLGVSAGLGRTLGPADDTVVGHPAAVVLSHAFWQRRFGGDPRIVGRTVSLSGEPMTVVGVMPAAFKFPGSGDLTPGDGKGPDAWAPLALKTEERANRGSRRYALLGRLHPGVGTAAAQAELAAICQRLGKAHPEEDGGWSARVLPLRKEIVGDIRPVLLLLWAAVGLVLLIACANVTNLLLARAASRQREIAVRTAIGASRGRLLSQLLTESLVLSLLGGGLGVGLARAGLAAFTALAPAGAVGGGPLALDSRVLAFAAGLCLLTTLLAGLVPALQATRPDLAQVLRSGNRGGAGRAGSRTRSALVVAEVALAVVLLIGAGLLLRSFASLLRVDPGFRTARAFSFDVDLPPARYPQPERRLFLDRVLDRLQALPGVAAVGAVSILPLSGNGNFDALLIEGRPLPTPDVMPPIANDIQATPGYFEAMGIPLEKGRTLTLSDSPEAPRVAVIDAIMAKTYWPGENPLGKRFRFGDPKDKTDPWYTVVGVVGNVHNLGLHIEPRPQMYLSAAQRPPLQLSFVVRATGDPRPLFAAARAAVREADREQPIASLGTLEEVVTTSVASRRVSLFLLGLFATLALLLSAIGIYGVTAHSVTERTREMGLRMALGAQRGGVLRLVVGEAGALVGAGVLLGLAAGFALTRVMASLLYGVAATDPATFAAVAVGLSGIALVAAYLPGQRATRVDPMVALRAE